jgi:alpha/beta superfamily hydrolase
MTKQVRIPVADTGTELEGRLGAQPVTAVVAPPHPLYGGHLSNPVVTALCDGLARRGIGALAFNWRGVGTSGGLPSGDATVAAKDYTAALAYVKGLFVPHSLPWVASGYSFGAATALAVAAKDPSVREVIVVAPPIMMLSRGLSLTADCRVTVIAASNDEFAPIEDLRRVFASIRGANVVTVENADHFFSSGGLDVVAQAAAGGG